MGAQASVRLRGVAARPGDRNDNVGRAHSGPSSVDGGVGLKCSPPFLSWADGLKEWAGGEEGLPYTQ